MPPEGRGRRLRTWWAMALLGLGVLLLHLLALHWLGDAFAPWASGRLPEPIYTQLLKPVPPVVHPPRPTAPPRHAAAPKPRQPSRHRPVSPAPAPSPETPPPPSPHRTLVADTDPAAAASSPAPQTSAPQPPISAPSPKVASSLGGEAAPGAISQPGAAPAGKAENSSARQSAPASSASAPVSDAAPASARAWPPSTRLSYTITGYWRGQLHGSGALVWTVDGDHYEATLEGQALIGFAYRSVGRIDGNWLAPTRYTERIFTREKSVRFDRSDGTLHFSASPQVLPLQPHVQDSASLFLQLANRLTRDPEAFQPGAQLTFAVARPSGMADWTFTVAGMTTVSTPEGPLSCWHIVRHAEDANQLGAQIWLSPQLQNLPVQIRLQHSADSYLLFTLDHAEQQALPQAPTSAAP